MNKEKAKEVISNLVNATKNRNLSEITKYLLEIKKIWRFGGARLCTEWSQKFANKDAIPCDGWVELIPLEIKAEVEEAERVKEELEDSLKEEEKKRRREERMKILRKVEKKLPLKIDTSINNSEYKTENFFKQNFMSNNC